jgi:hypothetical protein
MKKKRVGQAEVHVSEAAPESPRSTKRVYTAPVLVEWGRLRELTRGSQNGTEDFPPEFSGTLPI